MRTMQEIGEDIGTAFYIIKQITENITVEELQSFEKYIKEQESLGCFFNQNVYMKMTDIDGFVKVKNRIGIIKAIKTAKI